MMRILIAEDEQVTRRLLETTLARWGYDVQVTEDGDAALAKLMGDSSPQLAILDWMMPGMDGPDVCRRIRASALGRYVYIILLTAKDRGDDIESGLEAGADDYVKKPFDAKELRARVRVGERMVGLQNQLAEHVSKLEEALANVKQLQGLLPICAYCKKIRNDQNYWMQVEKYFGDHTEAKFSHSICPDCYERIVRPELEAELSET